MPSPARPPGISILIAWAPQSTSCRTHVGPARARVRSRTLKRARGSAPLFAMSDLPLRARWSISRSGRGLIPAAGDGHGGGYATRPETWEPAAEPATDGAEGVLERLHVDVDDR